MAKDRTLPVRRAILTALKADTAVIALVPAASIHPQSPLQEPSWPFIKYGAPAGLPVRASCVDGSEIDVAVHSFAKPRYSGKAMIETAEDHCSRIGAAVLGAIDAHRLPLQTGESARVRTTGWQLLQDGDEADAYHHVANFRVRVLA